MCINYITCLLHNSDISLDVFLIQEHTKEQCKIELGYNRLSYSHSWSLILSQTLTLTFNQNVHSHFVIFTVNFVLVRG